MKNPTRPQGHRARRFTTLTLLAALAMALLAARPQAAALTPPAVPASLQAPAGNVAYLMGHAYGTQDYVCLPAGSGFAWTFFGPQATLFDGNDQQIVTHFLSPNPLENGTPRVTWRHSRDTSTVWGASIATSTDPTFVARDAIPWLLVQVVGVQYGPAWAHNLTATTFIQRVNTAGGIAPTSGCDAAGDVGKKALVPYSTDYIFYTNRQVDHEINADRPFRP